LNVNTAHADKLFVGADALVHDAFTLGRMIVASGFRPEVLLALWRGGAPVGIVVHEFLRYKGIETYHAAVKVASYSGVDRRTAPRIEHFAGVLEQIAPNARVLLIDDIFDSGCTVQAVLACLAAKTRHVKIATVFLKEGRNQTDLQPDFVLHRTTRWVVFPHEMMDLSDAEIRAKRNHD
jgi:uncharacterized protein